MAILNYHHLRYFWAVAEDGNLTRTAARLHVSQSALSVQIRQLEDQLGHKLFERRGRRLDLSEAGRITRDHASAIFAAGDDLLATLAQTGTARKTLRVGALATLSRNFQMSFLHPVLGSPNVDIVLHAGSQTELVRGLQSLSLDVVLTNQPPAGDAPLPVITHKLSEQKVSLIGTPALLGDTRDAASLLATHPVILPAKGSSVRTLFDLWVNERGLRPRIAAEVDDMAMMRLLVRDGFALAILPPIVVRDELESYALTEADALPGISEIFYALTVERRFEHALVRSLIEAAKNKA